MKWAFQKVFKLWHWLSWSDTGGVAGVVHSVWTAADSLFLLIFDSQKMQNLKTFTKMKQAERFNVRFC